MKNFSKTVAIVLGVAMLSATPMQSYAASYRAAPELAKHQGVVIPAHRIRRRHRHRVRRHRHRRNRGAGVAAGIIGGLIIGGIIADSRNRSHSRDRSHVDWCYSRYRSYRARDNTYQPYHGRRRQCNSPYY
ncbi:MAG: BA14K family protein [Rhizobiaceae bacterium]|nr:BA14K family protein [Rhizobiaceae bacterium]